MELEIASDSDINVAKDGQGTSKEEEKYYRQKYNKCWEADPQLKGWLSAVKSDPHKAYCSKSC